MKTHICRTVQLLLHTAPDPQHSSISLTANSAIADSVPGTDTPRLRQCDVGRRGKQSTRQTAVCDEWWTARPEVRPPRLQDLHLVIRVPQRIEFKLAVLAFTWTTPCGRQQTLPDMDCRRQLRCASTLELNSHQRIVSPSVTALPELLQLVFGTVCCPTSSHCVAIAVRLQSTAEDVTRCSAVHSVVLRRTVQSYLPGGANMHPIYRESKTGCHCNVPHSLKTSKSAMSSSD